MGSGIPTGPRGGTHRARGSNIVTPRYQRTRVTHDGSYLCANVRFLSQLYFRQLRMLYILFIFLCILCIFRIQTKESMNFPPYIKVEYEALDEWKYELLKHVTFRGRCFDGQSSAMSFLWSS